MERTVETCGLKVYVIDTYKLAFHVDVSPHSAVVGGSEVYNARCLDWELTEDYHIVAPHCRITEIALVAGRVVTVATSFHILL